VSVAAPGTAPPSLLVFAGEGGVGKTTLAAATALKASLSGLRVAVMTIDPAPRLADALGLDRLDDEPLLVANPEPGSDNAGSLHALRLDTTGTFDRMVDRLADDNTVAERIKANPIYQAVAASTGSSAPYMAFQRLHELAESGRWDLIVVDTPPALHAEELLSAPSRLAGLLNTRAVALLVDPARAAAGHGTRLARATATLLLGMVERVTGAGLVGQVSSFVADFARLIESMVERSRDVEAMLAAPTSCFVLVSRACAASNHAGLALRGELLGRGFAVAPMVTNRLTPRPATVVAAGESKADLPADAPPGCRELLDRINSELKQLHETETVAIAELEDASQGAVLRVHDLAGEAGSLEDLGLLAAELTELGELLATAVRSGPQEYSGSLD